ncbi:hypothetical protein GA0070606_0673 [Micromonospora citrea]|uniref:Uncharacterized protein n=1 Tax=Micromonospora citrea TaxID=47855 RepID=A0A1C6TTY4_9ACTN|nr:hypothetical protein [Micromonospora citrea]SCL45256.1 hypothetical protein GA0070606_0673 [Micromonospora citrea]
MAPNESAGFLREGYRDTPVATILTIVGALVAIAGPVLDIAVNPATLSEEDPSEWALAVLFTGIALAFVGSLVAASGNKRQTARITAKIDEALHPPSTSVPSAEQPHLPPPGMSPPHDRVVSQLNDIVRNELRRMERRGLRMQWFFFAAGIPVGILINVFVG